MRSIDDERVVFYLQHQELIDAWAAARDESLRVAHDFYLSLADDLEDAAAALGPDVAVYRRDTYWGQIGLHKERWLDVEGTPILLAALEWQRHKTGFASGYRIAGIRVEISTEAGKELRPRIGDRIRDHRAARGFPRRTQWWPAFRDVGSAQGEYWTDLAPLRQTLVGEVVTAWEAFAGDLDDLDIG